MGLRPGAGRRPDLTRALAQYRQRAPRYDAELALFEPLRADAIARLALARGARVLDVGCGTGLSLRALQQCVGPGGRIVGIDPSPEMLAIARQRVERHRWRNVDLLQAPAAQAPLRGKADAALFHFTHDVLQDPQALAHLLAHLKRGATVVATGLRWAPAWMPATNAFVLLAALYSVTSLQGLERPWALLARHLEGLEVQTGLLGGIYIASGKVH